MVTGAAVVRDWCSEKGSLCVGRAMRLSAAVRATVLLIVRRWCGIRSSFSASERSSMSDIGMSSSSEASELVFSSARSLSPADESESLSSSAAKSI